MELASFAHLATLTRGPRGKTGELGTLGTRGEPNAPAWQRASQFEELAPRARRHTHVSCADSRHYMQANCAILQARIWRNNCGCDGDGHGDDDGDGQLRLARQSRHVRRVPEVRLCQMHCVRDASQVRQVRQVARWARPHLLLRPSSARTPKSTLGRHGYGAPPLHGNAVKLLKLT